MMLRTDWLQCKETRKILKRNLKTMKPKLDRTSIDDELNASLIINYQLLLFYKYHFFVFYTAFALLFFAPIPLPTIDRLPPKPPYPGTPWGVYPYPSDYFF